MQLEDGTKVFLVNGGYVRDNFDVDWVWGGHHFVYKWIPEDEIWVERHESDPHDTIALITHVVIEYKNMKYKKEKYPKAHENASLKEKQVRQRRT